MPTDHLQSFLFDNTDIRGAIVTLDKSLADQFHAHDYSTAQQTLLGRFLAANLLMSSHIKLDGLLSLQVRGQGPVSLLMSECTQDLAFRGIIRSESDIDADNFQQLFAGGMFAITMEPKQGNRYQGIVAIEKPTLADCLAGYFEQSEQLPTRFYFAEHRHKITGLMLQALPASQCLDDQQRREDWQRILCLTDTITAAEACELPTETLLHRLYHEEALRVFNPRAVRFHCNCSRERMERALLSMDHDELDSILAEDGRIETECHFCHRQYVFQQAEMQHLLQSGNTH